MIKVSINGEVQEISENLNVNELITKTRLHKQGFCSSHKHHFCSHR